MSRMSQLKAIVCLIDWLLNQQLIEEDDFFSEEAIKMREVIINLRLFYIKPNYILKLNHDCSF